MSLQPSVFSNVCLTSVMIWRGVIQFSRLSSCVAADGNVSETVVDGNVSAAAGDGLVSEVKDGGGGKFVVVETMTSTSSSRSRYAQPTHRPR